MASPFIYQYVEHYLEVVDWASTTFRSEHVYLLEAAEPSRFYTREYTWTGSGEEKEPIPEIVSDIDIWGFPQHRIHGPLVTEGSTRILVVDLGRTIRTGESAMVTFRHKMKDLNGTFRPYLSAKQIDGIRNSLSLSVALPNWNNLKVTYQLYTADSEKVIDVIDLLPSGKKEEHFVFKKEVINRDHLSMGHRLCWTHNES